MNKTNTAALRIQRETYEVYSFINKYRYVFVLTIFALSIINTIGPVYAGDLFDKATNLGSNLSLKLTDVLTKGIFPAVAIICACGIALSKDPKKVETFKSWLIRAVVAFFIVQAYDLVLSTVESLMNGGSAGGSST